MKIGTWPAMAGVVLFAFATRAAEPLVTKSAPGEGNAPTVQGAGRNAAAPFATQGVRVYLDPATGEMVDGPVLPEQRADSLALPAPDYSRVTFETREDGSVIAHSNGQFESTSTITLDTDGTVRIGCTQTGDHAKHGHPAQSAEAPR